ncbi:protein of unknown function [Caminicella sporogenes DSM 14501]|uniref:DUF1904 domain-containing protein n=1 Tax=Caminicella sporogenes DSM 14501 TaxID=1121266 RepID=A0A1M6N3U4_9FIRM|nr:DUF1904 domain-containing protein [Caminicella sporogenes]RKD22374.1 hypothetical protein BET04_04895 [Caminicella sporogenes]WIF95173.1 DUF1904 domain-containing protein [Caminicella sporogenes]SHJ90358.1 protein of unknown function [Caminicella sporogenes DSM 14501]
MPQLKIRGIEAEKIKRISKELIDELTEVVGCPRDYFTIECFNTTSIFDGEIVQTYPFIEVAWFDRGQEVQDKVAKIITKYIHSLNIESLDIAFTVFNKNSYYENGEHF